jgi:creatine kinase
MHCPTYFGGWGPIGAEFAKHNGTLYLKDTLTEEMYNELATRTTSLGVSVDKCIKGGVDKVAMENRGKKWNTGLVGLMFGDAESVDLFKELTHPVIKARHGNPKLPHPAMDVDIAKLIGGGENPYTPEEQKYIETSRIRTGRSVSGFPLAPSLSKEKRDELEALIVGSLKGIEDEELKGDYYPLHGSSSYPDKPGGISEAEEKELISSHLLFQEPYDEPMLISWRMERDWPDGRGAFINTAKNALVWVNEEDHMRVMAMESTANIHDVFRRFSKILEAVKGAVESAGKQYSVHEEFGNILACPSNMGTGLRGGHFLKIPLCTKEPNFKAKCDELRIQARGTGGFASDAPDDGRRDISNIDRMGYSEIELVNKMIEGTKALVAWEMELEAKAAGGAGEAPAAVTEDPAATEEAPAAE